MGIEGAVELPVLDPWFGVMIFDQRQVRALRQHPTHRLTIMAPGGGDLRVQLREMRLKTAGIINVIDIIDGNPHVLDQDQYDPLRSE